MRDRDQYEWQETPKPRLTAATFAVGTFAIVTILASIYGLFLIGGK